MQGKCGVWDQEKEDEDTRKEASVILTGIRRMTENKYSDLLLLGSVAAGFGALLIVSSLS